MRAFANVKRGRPKRQTANDPANGPANDNEKDRGTPELQSKRAALAKGVEAAAVSHPLDLLLAHGHIDAAEHRAGWRYAGLYRRLVGRTEVSYSRLYAGLGGDGGRAGADAGGDDDLASAQILFRKAQLRLRGEGAVVAGLTERLAVFGAFPGWLLQQDAAARRERSLLRRGLQQLAQSFRSSKAR
ncbi:hypothetical protein [Dongia sp.]|uniref:hypothetical protein n=1 Tax=Dongia sp. TaxID=1977262 RepID=UPI0035B19DF8